MTCTMKGAHARLFEASKYSGANDEVILCGYPSIRVPGARDDQRSLRLIEAHEERPKTKSVFQARSNNSRLGLSIHVTLVGCVSRDLASYIKAGRAIDQGQAIHSHQNPDEISSSSNLCNPHIHTINTDKQEVGVLPHSRALNLGKSRLSAVDSTNTTRSLPHNQP